MRDWVPVLKQALDQLEAGDRAAAIKTLSQIPPEDRKVIRAELARLKSN